MLADQPALPAFNQSPVKGPGGNLTLAYGPDSGGLLRCTAELIQVDWPSSATRSPCRVSSCRRLRLQEQPRPSTRPPAATPVPDAANPDTCAQPFWATDGGISNFATEAPAIDKPLTQAAVAPATQAAALYRTISRDFVASGSVV
jgi:hypothetical protein